MTRAAVSSVDVWGIYGRGTLRSGSGRDFRVEVRSLEFQGGKCVIPVVLEIDADHVPEHEQKLLALKKAFDESSELQRFSFEELAQKLRTEANPADN